MQIHAFYRIWFTVIDPVVLVFTVLVYILRPSIILETSIPSSIVPYNTMSHNPLLHQSAALYAFMAIIFGVLLRASSDIKVWKIIQFATLVVNCGLLVTMWAILKSQGRLDLSEWRDRDWFNTGFTVWVALIRIAFLGGVGVSSRDG